MFLSQPTLFVFIPLISLAGPLYSSSVEENFLQGFSGTAIFRFYSLLLTIIIPVYVLFHLWTWMDFKLFRHN
ncbi:phosphatidylinositol N-acetylglucosaminyltransferase subunit Y-like [Cavia porcellus]|uniref:phosphatidylinositol N-acetylglucosaminyltransferase subunit Y-like n=1 Tax=Cavia porcellus TaxID=10141 RepID=UPI00022B5F7D|nr:phosphatidylinositol N-acetylglucosaminyltransferase subunit Y-like [Cavia porcellus]